MASPAFRAFEKSMTVHAHLPLWQADYNLGALKALRGREKAKAEDMLCEVLVDSPEPRAVRALGSIRSDFAVPVLQACCNQYQDHSVFVAEVAKALWDICEDDQALPILLHTLASGDPDAKVVAAAALAGRVEAEAQSALFAALADPDDTVRAGVVDALWLHLRLPAKYARISRLGEMKTGLCAADALRRRKWRKLLGDYLRERALGNDIASWTRR